eukprot:TRINITY_DN66546_c11_g7_i2.p2 TRINITY_DN66546_c11_g7~~TRINITY_DN66546_c11_g7_i2.p2  ORF type:complete len:419 (+),score=266.62 TRINITY_DN66546_c11_g7_i2:295-1551(+)
MPHGMGGRGEDDGPVDNEKFYKLLGVDKTASKAEIKKAFRRAAVKHHPDKGGDEDTFKAINEAYKVLGDDDKRELYDKYGEEGVKNGGGPGMGHADIFDLFTGGRGRGRGGGSRQRRGEDVVFPLKVTLDDLYKGCMKKLRLTKNVICTGCNGKGGKADAVQMCKSCKGQGVKVMIRQLGPGMIQQMQTVCNECHGERTVIADEHKCATCSGKKTLKQKKTLEVYVNKGMRHGQKIEFRGEADQSPNTTPGDVIVVLQQKEHEVFTRDNNHLFMKKSITLVEALCGFEFPIEHLDGRVLLVKSEDGQIIKPGSFQVIRDEGMPKHKNPYVKGDLYIEFEVVFPKNGELAANTRKLLQKILPAPEQKDMDTLPDDHEQVSVQEVDIESERQQYQRDAREAYEEDDDDHHHHGGPTCANQ